MTEDSNQRPFPVFVVGAGRSGTTMLGERLGRIPNGLCLPESQFVTDIISQNMRDPKFDVAAALNYISKDFRFGFWKVSEHEVALLYKRLPSDIPNLIVELCQIHSRNSGISSLRFWVDHTPSNLSMVGRLAKAFPDARFINIVRDGRAVTASLLNIRDWGPSTVLGCARLWTSAIAHGNAAQMAFSDRVCLVRYEDLILNEQTELLRLANFLGINECHSDTRGAFAVPGYTKHQHMKVGLSFDQSRINGWNSELSQKQIEQFESITGDLLELLNYPPVFGCAAKPMRTKQLAWLNFLELTAMVFVKPILKRIRRWQHRNR